MLQSEDGVNMQHGMHRDTCTTYVHASVRRWGDHAAWDAQGHLYKLLPYVSVHKHRDTPAALRGRREPGRAGPGRASKLS
jgi:hypothetical protein